MPPIVNVGEVDEATVNYALLTTNAPIFSRVLKVAINTGFFDIIKASGRGSGSDTASDKGNGYISCSEIARKLQADKNPEASSMIDRLLFVLACHDLLTCSVKYSGAGNFERLYKLAPAGTFYVENDDGCSFSNLFLMDGSGKQSASAWHHLKDAITEGGIAFERAFGVSMYDNMGMSFNKAMSDHSHIIMKRLVEKYKGFENCKTLVDVGGGIGVSLHMITSKYPTIRGINFDMPAVVTKAPCYPGIEHVGGDMFESVPKAETILMKWVAHNYDDARAVKLLKNCYESLPEKGKVVIIDCMLPVEPDSSAATKYVSLLNCAMQTFLGGKERTKFEFEYLSKAAGFSEIRFVVSCCTNWVIELCK